MKETNVKITTDNKIFNNIRYTIALTCIVLSLYLSIFLSSLWCFAPLLLGYAVMKIQHIKYKTKTIDPNKPISLNNRKMKIHIK